MKPLSMAMVDIDFFKKVNDTYGHIVGDMILKELARLLKSNFRKIDTVARFGGEEFTVMLPAVSLEHSAVIMERFRSLVEAHAFPIDDAGNTVSITVSIGLSAREPSDAMDKYALIKAADTALYRAKNNGRNQICLSDASHM